ncbi:hypothetical protein DPMN_136185 [Dreissena polymorpha]|uniref:Uncharacterized protein n=1 Tax=Dreissena polymorpha TaxID=45954 RepID=A0A9D4G0F1_DREPO|nr:hypothetical protein DPMN_136185 [Dreissena polymorpha]
MILGVSVLELSSDNHLVDRPTDMSKEIYPLFIEGGHKNNYLGRNSQKCSGKSSKQLLKSPYSSTLQLIPV